MAVTLNDIAKMVGVKKATVSRVLNDKPNPVKVSELTKKKIFEAAATLGYHPNAAARALTTRRTGHLGFILSDAVTGGWANMYYATIFSGVESACREYGYGLNASRYNLTNVDSFVFPTRVGQRNVDGLILTGHVQVAVVARFREFGIPCVSIGDDLEISELIPTVSCDIVGGLYRAVRFAAERGHTRVGYCMIPTRRGREVAQLLLDRVLADPATANCELSQIVPQGQADYQAAGPIARDWLAMPADRRPTVLIASDQTLLSLTAELGRRGVQCPRDIQLISTCDTDLCLFSSPRLTAINQNLESLGRTTVNLLVNHLDKGQPLTSDMSQNNYPCELIIRESCM